MDHYLKFFNSGQYWSNQPVKPLSLLKQSIHEIHRNSLKTLCSGSSESIEGLRDVLKRLPEMIQDQIFNDLVDLSETFHLVDIKPTLPAEWSQKYFCFLIHVITDEYSQYCEEWSGHLSLIPDDLKTDLVKSLEEYFYEDDKPTDYEEKESWLEKYLHLIEDEVCWAYHGELGYSKYDICGTP